MDYFRLLRLLFWLCAGLYLGGFVSLAMADYPASVRYSYDFWTDAPCNNGWEQPGSSPGALCGAAVGCRNQIASPAVALASTSWSEASGTGSCLASFGNAIANYRRGYYCPNGGVLNGTTCSTSCPSGQTWNSQTQQCQATCTAGSNAGYYSTGFTTTACINGCSYTRSASGSVSTCSGWSDATGWSSCFLAQSGSTCLTPNGAPSSGMAQCPVGQCPGTINGATVCMPCTGKTDVQSTGTKTTTNADGSTTTTTTTTNSTSQGGTTTTTTTTNTTNTPAGGGTPTNSTTSSTDTKPTDSFCIENPSSPLCKQSSFGGSCGSFSCDGDAIQCAMAQEQHKRNCTMFDTQTTLSQLGDQVAAGNDPQKSTFPNESANVQVVNLGTQIDTSNPLVASCLSDKVIAFPHFSVTLPFSTICPYLEMMGRIVIAFALMMAARIALGGL